MPLLTRSNITCYGRTDVSYLLVTYDPVDGLIAKRSAGRPPKKLVIPEGCDPQQLYDQHKMQDGKRLLLIFLFASDEELRLLMMHPEFIACDTTLVNRRLQ